MGQAVWFNYVDTNRGEGFTYDETEACRLGNMTLLKSTANREFGVISYSAKREQFLNNSFQLTQKLAENYLTWTLKR